MKCHTMRPLIWIFSVCRCNNKYAFMPLLTEWNQLVIIYHIKTIQDCPRHSPWPRFCWCCLCADPGIFVRGGSRSVWQKKLWQRFLVLSLFYRSQMVNFKEIYHFSNFFRGGGGGGGGQLLIPYRNPYNLWFSRGGGGPDPLSPLWIRTCCFFV